MFLAIVDITVAPADRAAALAALQEAAAAVREMPGNINFRAFLDPFGDESLCILHEWADQASFAAYGASAAFADLGRVLRPLTTRPPISRRLRAELVETVA